MTCEEINKTFPTMIPLNITRRERDEAIASKLDMVRLLNGVHTGNERFFATCAWITATDGADTVEDLMSPALKVLLQARMDKIGPDADLERLCQSLLLHEHFPTCDKGCVRPDHTLHQEPLHVEILTGYGEDLLQYKSYHTLRCLAGRHFRLGRTPLLTREERLCVVVGVERGHLIVSYRPERSDGFHSLVRWLAPVDEWSAAIGLDGHRGPPCRSPLTVEKVPPVWPELVMGPDTTAPDASHLLNEPLPDHPTLETVASVCTVPLLKHQLYTVLWMQMRAAVPLWRFVGFEHQGSRVMYGGAQVESDLFGGLLRSSPKTGRTLSVLTFAAMCGERVTICTSRTNLNKWTRQKNYLFARHTQALRICVPSDPEALEGHILIMDLADTSSTDLANMARLPQRTRFVMATANNLQVQNRLLGVSPPRQLTHWTEILSLHFGRDCIMHAQENCEHILSPPEWPRVLEAQQLFIRSVERFNVAAVLKALRLHVLPPGVAVTLADKQVVVKCFETHSTDSVCPVCAREDVYVLTCGHHLCVECAARESVQKCPLCMQPLSLMSLPRILPRMDEQFYEGVAAFVAKHRLRRWLIIGGEAIACALVRRHVDVLFVARSSNRTVSDYSGRAVVVWDKHPDNVYVDAFDDIAFCHWTQTFYGSVHSSVRVHYFFLPGSMNHYCYHNQLTKPKPSHIRDWSAVSSA